MDPKFQTSFIPKKPMIPGSMGVPTKKPTNILSTISIFLVVVTILLSAGAFLYEKKLVRDNEEKKQKIESEIKTFDPALTNQLTLLKSRVDAAKELLKNHLALTNFFNLLNENTVSTIQFKDFSYTGGPGKPLIVKLSGQAKSFNDLIFQSDTILANPNLKNVVFSGFDLDKNGNVIFMMDAEINQSYISYQKMLDGLASSVPETVVPPVASESTSAVGTSTTSGAVGTSTATTTTP